MIEPGTESVVLSVTEAGEEMLGTVHWGHHEEPQGACDIANQAAQARADSIGTCITTRAQMGTGTCYPGGPKGWEAYAVSANHRGSC